MAEKRLIDANSLDAEMETLMVRFAALGRKKVAEDYNFVRTVLDNAPTVDAVEVEDKKLLKAIKMLIEQYGHSKKCDYVHSPVAHALFHTWRRVDKMRKL